MKKSIWLVFMLLVSGVTFSQNETAFLDRLVQRKYTEAGQYFGDQVDLYIDNREETLGRTAAIGKIESFFRINPLKSYVIKHQGTSKARQSSYYVCDLSTSNGPYRLFVYFDEERQGRKITELRLEKD